MDHTPATDTTAPPPTRKKPGWLWYALSAVLMVGSIAVFVLVLLGNSRAMREQIEPMPRFVGPTGDGGFVLTIDEPGKYHVFYENLGSLDGRSFDTPRRQVWTTFDAPSMTCAVTRVDTGDAVEVRLPGVGVEIDKRQISEDLVFPYKLPGMQGHTAWVFEAEQPGEYRFDLAYVDAVLLEPGEIEIPPELSRADKQDMTSTEGEAYEAARRSAMQQAALSQLEPIDVLFAVGQDPSSGGYFQVIGIKGAATVLAFGFTASVLIALVTLMLRGGHVTPRGELANVKRLGNKPD